MNGSKPKIRIFVPVCGAMIFLFLCTPILITLPMSFSDSSTLEFPPSGLSLRWYENFAHSPIWVQAMSTSLQLAATSSLIALLLGSLAAYGLVRSNIMGAVGLEAHFMAPMIIPNIITAIALYFAFAKLGILGTFGGLVVGHALVAIPFVITVVSGAVKAFDIRIEQSARSLGAKWLRVLVSIVIPNIYPALFVAWIFSFVISFDEVILTYFLSGTYVTIPKEMFTQLQEQVDPTITAVASLLIIGSLLLLLATARFSARLASGNRA